MRARVRVCLHAGRLGAGEVGWVGWVGWVGGGYLKRVQEVTKDVGELLGSGRRLSINPQLLKAHLNLGQPNAHSAINIDLFNRQVGAPARQCCLSYICMCSSYASTLEGG